jgi:hypothetical protein
MNTQSLEVAKTIQQQLFAFGKMKVWSWGSNSWKVISNGLSFRVQGFKFKGVVQVTLTPFDTYKVEFIKAKKVIQEFTDVYFDELTNIIDATVEYTGDNYQNDVANAEHTF